MVPAILDPLPGTKCCTTPVGISKINRPIGPLPIRASFLHPTAGRSQDERNAWFFKNPDFYPTLTLLSPYFYPTPQPSSPVSASNSTLPPHSFLCGRNWVRRSRQPAPRRRPFFQKLRFSPRICPGSTPDLPCITSETRWRTHSRTIRQFSSPSPDHPDCKRSLQRAAEVYFQRRTCR